jgi:hypothetical protein
MSEQTFSLESLRIAAPCRESWDEMAGTDEVRFCSHCSKSVHDFSQLTRAEAERLVARARGGLCVRLVRRADSSVVVKESLSGFRRIGRRVSLVASAALAALLGLLTDARAQQNTTYKSKSCPDSRVNVSRTRREGVSAQAERGTLAGTLIDPNGAAIPGARVSLKKQDAKRAGKGERKDARAGRVAQETVATGDPNALSLHAVMTNDMGAFNLKSVEPGVYTLIVEANGFKRFEIENVTIRDGEDVRFDVAVPLTTMEVLVGVVALPEMPSDSFPLPINRLPISGIGRPEE